MLICDPDTTPDVPPLAIQKKTATLIAMRERVATSVFVAFHCFKRVATGGREARTQSMQCDPTDACTRHAGHAGLSHRVQ